MAVAYKKKKKNGSREAAVARVTAAEKAGASGIKRMKDAELAKEKGIDEAKRKVQAAGHVTRKGASPVVNAGGAARKGESMRGAGAANVHTAYQSRTSAAPLSGSSDKKLVKKSKANLVKNARKKGLPKSTVMSIKRM